MNRLLLGCAIVLAATGLSCAGDIVEQEKDRVFSPDEIRAALISSDFRTKNKARAQLETLPAPDRLALLVEVSSSPDPATRTLAVVELAKLGDLGRPQIQRIADVDPDPDVKELAAMFLEGDDEDDEEN